MLFVDITGNPDAILDQQAVDHEFYGAALNEMVHLGLEIARTIHRQVVSQAFDSPNTPIDAGAPLAFERVSRVVRRSIMLARRLHETRLHETRLHEPAAAEPSPARPKAVAGEPTLDRQAGQPRAPTVDESSDDGNDAPGNATKAERLNADRPDTFDRPDTLDRPDTADCLDSPDWEDAPEELSGHRPLLETINDLRKDLGLPALPARASRPDAAQPYRQPDPAHQHGTSPKHEPPPTAPPEPATASGETGKPPSNPFSWWESRGGQSREPGPNPETHGPPRHAGA